MLGRLLPGSLRAQMAISIALVTALGVGASFLALYSGTGTRLRAQVESQLHTQTAEWRQYAKHTDISTPSALSRAAHGFIAGQRYHAEALLIVVEVNGGQIVSNNAEVIAREERDHHGSTVGLLHAPLGLTTSSVAEAGTVRVLSRAIYSGRRRVGTLRVASPLTPVAQAQASLLRTFAIVGALAVVLAVAAGVGLASLIVSPLRRIAQIAGDVAAGDLSLRSGMQPKRGEVGALSRAFDRMLERLERAFRRQREFVSDASHELKTPLAVLRAQVELLDRETDEARRHEATRLLLRRLDELDRLVSDMLTLASAEAGQLIEPAPVDLGDFFEDLRRDLPLFGERDYHLEPLEGTLVADGERLTQVLRNLIRNAVAHTDEGDRIEVRAATAGDRLAISVSDSGPGIPADQLDHVFERFRRLPGSRQRDPGGSGLGLAIARALVEAHGGSIRAESTLGHGATLIVELPGYRAPAAALTPGRSDRGS